MNPGEINEVKQETVTKEKAMGVDLALAIASHCPVRDWFLAYNRLDTNRDYDFQGRIAKVPAEPLPPGMDFQWYGDDGIKSYTEDCYGAPLRITTAGRLSEMRDPGPCPRNKAVMAYLAALPPETQVVLWWH